LKSVQQSRQIDRWNFHWTVDQESKLLPNDSTLIYNTPLNRAAADSRLNFQEMFARNRFHVMNYRKHTARTMLWKKF